MKVSELTALIARDPDAALPIIRSLHPLNQPYFLFLYDCAKGGA